MAEAVYVLCALTSLACTILLLRSHRRNGMPFLFWSGLCFICFALNNLLLLISTIFRPVTDLAVPRNLAGVVGTCLLLYGVLWSKEPPPRTERHP